MNKSDSKRTRRLSRSVQEKSKKIMRLEHTLSMRDSRIEKLEKELQEIIDGQNEIDDANGNAGNEIGDSVLGESDSSVSSGESGASGNE